MGVIVLVMMGWGWVVQGGELTAGAAGGGLAHCLYGQWVCGVMLRNQYDLIEVGR